MRYVTLKQFRVFAAVIQSGSVTGAAQALHVTPSAVTLQMQLLEAQAGLPVVERTPNGMVATSAGREILMAVEKIEAAVADCSAELANLAGNQQGKVSVGIVSTAKYFAPRALATFARTHPGIELQLSIGNRAEIIEGLKHYAIEVAIMGRPPEDLRVTKSVIGEHPHLIVASPDHPLAGRRALRPADLAAETFVVREPGSGTQALTERFFAEVGLQPRIGMQIGSNETIKQAVMAGLGIACISGHTVDAELASGRLVVLDVVGLPIIRQWHVVHLSDRRMMPAAKTVSRFLSEEAGIYLPSVTARASPKPSPRGTRRGRRI